MSDVVQRAAHVAGRAVVRLGRLLDDPHGLSALALRLGWSLPEVPAPLPAVAAALRGVATQLEAVRANPDDPAAWSALIAAVASGVEAIRALAGADFGPVLGGLGFADEFPTQIVHWAAIDQLADDHPRLLAVLRAAGIVVARGREPAGRPSYLDERFVMPPFGAALSDPALLLRTAWAWGAPDFDATALLDELAATFRHHGVPAGYVEVTASAIERGGLEIESTARHLLARLFSGRTAAGDYAFELRFVPVFDTDDAPGIAIIPELRGAVAIAIPFGDGYQFSITGGATAGTDRAIVVYPTRIELVDDLLGDAGGAPASAGLAVAIERLPGPARLTLGIGDAARVSFRGWKLTASAAAAPADLAIELALTDPQLGLPTADSGLIGAGEATFAAPFVVGASTTRGVYLGAGGLAREVPGEVRIGPATLRELRLALAGNADGLVASATATAAVQLGPVAIALHGLGAALALTFPAGGGNLGPLDLAARIVPPDGATVAIDAAVARGGGTVQRIAGREYRGALALDLLGVSATALGIVDDSPENRGSFVAAISATFAPIQLGLGVTLRGLGGVIAAHRRVDTEALRGAIRGAGLGGLLFPTDLAGQASRLLGDLGRYFPPARGRFVVGPAAKLGWGTPNLVDAEVALLLELPAPVRMVLLGSLRAALPDADHPILALGIDLVGELDLSRRTLAIDASLRDSAIAGFPLTGDMALRAAWGDPPAFVLSVGGFHSQFTPPPGFPALRRVRIPIGADDDPRIDITGFFAVTSNTVQLGADASLRASAGPLNIVGELGFEALLQRSPFRFRVDLWAGVALRRGSTTLAGVHFDGTLSGPSPWRVAGEACLSLWFIDLCVDFDATFGSDTSYALPPRAVWPLLQAALEAPASWGSALPVGAARVVTLAAAVDAAPGTRIDPVASLSVRQSIAPLDRKLTRFGEVAPSGPDTFAVTRVVLGANPASFTRVSEWFAPAQFEQLSDADRLSRPGFEQMTAGVSVANAAVTAGAAHTAALIYETILIQGPTRAVVAPYRPTRAAQLLGVARAGTATAPLRPRADPPPRVHLAEEHYVIASTLDLSARLDLAPAGSRGATELALAAVLAADPGAREHLQVLPAHEVP